MEPNKVDDLGKKKKTGGRKKGVPNKISATVKDNVIAVFNQIGGIERMAEWADENPGNFYNLYAKLMPIDTNVSVNGSLDIKQIIIKGVTSE